MRHRAHGTTALGLADRAIRNSSTALRVLALGGVVYYYKRGQDHICAALTQEATEIRKGNSALRTEMREQSKQLLDDIGSRIERLAAYVESVTRTFAAHGDAANARALTTCTQQTRRSALMSPGPTAGAHARSVELWAVYTATLCWNRKSPLT